MGFGQLWALEIARLRWGWHHPLAVLLLMVVVTSPVWLSALWRNRR